MVQERWLEQPQVNKSYFNRHAQLPPGMTLEDIQFALERLYSTLNTVNQVLVQKIGLRLEELLRPNTFPDVLSTILVRGLGEHSETWTWNRKHDGFPDLVKKGQYPENKVHRGEGIEIKAVKSGNTPQGHNPERCWLIVFHYNVDRESEPFPDRSPTEIVTIQAAELETTDWTFSRGNRSRRTKTASVNRNGLEKLRGNVIYQREE